MLTTREAAQRLGLKTTGAVRQLILADRLKAKKIGRDWMIEESEIELYQQSRRPVGRPKNEPVLHGSDSPDARNVPNSVPAGDDAQPD